MLIAALGIKVGPRLQCRRVLRFVCDGLVRVESMTNAHWIAGDGAEPRGWMGPWVMNPRAGI